MTFNNNFLWEERKSILDYDEVNNYILLDTNIKHMHKDTTKIRKCQLQ